MKRLFRTSEIAPETGKYVPVFYLPASESLMYNDNEKYIFRFDKGDKLVPYQEGREVPLLLKKVSEEWLPTITFMGDIKKNQEMEPLPKSGHYGYVLLKN
jgi:hypothetical protein